jgi:hypothetical protein
MTQEKKDGRSRQLEYVSCVHTGNICTGLFVFWARRKYL